MRGARQRHPLRPGRLGLDARHRTRAPDRCGDEDETVWLNAHNKLFAEAETDGYRESGYGRLHGLEGMNDFLETKHVYMNVEQLDSC